MPIYKFKCSECEHEFTLIRKISDSSEVICECCSSSLTNKLVSSTSFSLKGKGWYKDGYSNQEKTEKTES